MSFRDHFADFCPYSIDVEPFMGSDEAGKSLHGTAIQIPCQIEEKVKLVRAQDGQERASNTTVYALGGPIDPRDRITLPATFKGHRQPPIIAVSNVNDKTGFDHSEVYL